MRRTTVMLPDDLAHRLDIERERRRTSLADLIGQALEANPEAYYSLEELSIAEAYRELPADVRERLAKAGKVLP